MIKNLLKIILRKYNYRIQKIVRKESEVEYFVRNNKWLQTQQIDCVLDIGANEGQFASKILALLPSIELHCFEPISEPFIELQRNLQNFQNVRLHRFALGNKETITEINVNEYSPSSSFLKMTKEHQNNFDFALETELTTVTIKKLDNINIARDQNILIKIDVQGFEDQVIEGGICTLSSAKIVIIEVSFKELYNGQPLFNKLYRQLYELGFSYRGSMEQLTSPLNGEMLQADAVFIKRN